MLINLNPVVLGVLWRKKLKVGNIFILLNFHKIINWKIKKKSIERKKQHTLKKIVFITKPYIYFRIRVGN